MRWTLKVVINAYPIYKNQHFSIFYIFFTDKYVLLIGTSIRFGIITKVEKRGIVTIKVGTEWAALHRLEVGMQMDLTGW